MFTFVLGLEKAIIGNDFTSVAATELWYFECRD